MLKEETRLELVKLAMQVIQHRNGGGTIQDVWDINSSLLSMIRGSDTMIMEAAGQACLEQFPHSDLCSINAGTMPPSLMKRLQKLAYREIERRRMTR